MRFGETLGTTIEHMLQRDAARTRRAAAERKHELRARRRVRRHERARRGRGGRGDAGAASHGARDRCCGHAIGCGARYGLRELILPEKYRVEAGHDVVVTYSSDLALLYFADDPHPLDLDQIAGDNRRAALYDALLDHPGVGLLGGAQRNVGSRRE